jgi:hypothetical protein
MSSETMIRQQEQLDLFDERDEEKPWQPLSMAKRAEPSIMELMVELNRLAEEAVELGK